MTPALDLCIVRKGDQGYASEHISIKQTVNRNYWFTDLDITLPTVKKCSAPKKEQPPHKRAEHLQV